MDKILIRITLGGGGGGVTSNGGRIPDAQEKKNAGKGYPNQGWARNARIAKRVSKSREMGEKGYPNRYDHSSSRGIIRDNGR